jgi:hypothetical protein
MSKRFIKTKSNILSMPSDDVNWLPPPFSGPKSFVFLSVRRPAGGAGWLSLRFPFLFFARSQGK